MIALIPVSSFADGLAGTHLVCSGTTFDFKNPMDVTDWVIELGNNGEAFVGFVNNNGNMYYEYSETQVSLDWPAHCSSTDMSKCQYYGRILRADGDTLILDNVSRKVVLNGTCLPLKTLF